MAVQCSAVYGSAVQCSVQQIVVYCCVHKTDGDILPRAVLLVPTVSICSVLDSMAVCAIIGKVMANTIILCVNGECFIPFKSKNNFT